MSKLSGAISSVHQNIRGTPLSRLLLQMMRDLWMAERTGAQISTVCDRMCQVLFQRGVCRGDRERDRKEGPSGNNFSMLCSSVVYEWGGCMSLVALLEAGHGTMVIYARWPFDWRRVKHVCELVYRQVC